MLFVRENTEGEYSGIDGRAHRSLPSEVAIEASVFTRHGVERVIRYAFERAVERRGVLTSAKKSNASRFGYVLWDEIAEEVAAETPGVRYECVLVDALAARMVRDPGSLDVVVASNLFADILTDLAAAIQRGMGMAASANLAPGSGTPRPVRAGSRLGPGHRGPGCRKPGGGDLERVADAGLSRRARRRAGVGGRVEGRLPRRPANARRGRNQIHARRRRRGRRAGRQRLVP